MYTNDILAFRLVFSFVSADQLSTKFPQNLGARSAKNQNEIWVDAERKSGSGQRVSDLLYVHACIQVGSLEAAGLL